MDKFFSSKFFLILLVLILIGVITALGKESYRKYQLNKEIDNLKQEITSLEEENKKISELLNYFESDEFLEKQARLKLNLLKQGEKLVIINSQEQESDLNVSDSNLNLKDKQESKKISNIKKWWSWFGF